MARRDLFHSAALKLTLYYLAVILIISLIFSSTLYHLAANEIKQTAARPNVYQQLVIGSGISYSEFREQQVSLGIKRLRANLVLFNLAVLLFGGLASYWLARRTLEPIAEALEAQSRFTADASHELRTPLTVIQTENEVTLRDKQLTKDQAVAQLKSNLEEVAKLQALSEGLLTLAKADPDRDLAETVSTTQIVKQAIERVAKVAKTKKIKINHSTKNLAVRGQPDQLVQLVTILLDNAIKYSQTGSRVTVSTNRRDKQAQIKVTDWGQGINKIDLPHIFERFYRADGARSRDSHGGYGLGLAIAKKISDLHKGSIDVSSSPGQGASFVVRLPLA